MVNKLSDLAQFLDDESIPFWLKKAINEKQHDISTALQKGDSFSLSGPNGELITITPKAAVVA
jgi:hypothetical protein